MAVINILKYGNPLLHKPSEEVKNFNSEIENIVNDMFDTIVKFDGLGLAAVQIGKLQRIIVIDTTRYENGKRLVIINPRIISKSLITETDNEGCLSLPGLYADIERPKRIEVEGRTINGELIKIKANNLLARVIQHEIDHIDGMLFINRVDKKKKKELEKEWKKLKKGIK